MYWQSNIQRYLDGQQITVLIPFLLANLASLTMRRVWLSTDKQTGTESRHQ